MIYVKKQQIDRTTFKEKTIHSLTHSRNASIYTSFYYTVYETKEQIGILASSSTPPGCSWRIIQLSNPTKNHHHSPPCGVDGGKD